LLQYPELALGSGVGVLGQPGAVLADGSAGGGAVEEAREPFEIDAREDLAQAAWPILGLGQASLLR
jgi:hypothetical protein